MKRTETYPLSVYDIFMHTLIKGSNIFDFSNNEITEHSTYKIWIFSYSPTEIQFSCVYLFHNWKLQRIKIDEKIWNKFCHKQWWWLHCYNKVLVVVGRVYIYTYINIYKKIHYIYMTKSIWMFIQAKIGRKNIWGQHIKKVEAKKTKMPCFQDFDNPEW